MDVTSGNFRALYPTIRAQIQSEDTAFIAIDEEMTGIQDRAAKISANDTPAERYKKMIPVATKYSIIQFGLSIFQLKPGGDGTYTTYTYNFYLFPTSGSDLVLSADAITFLRNNGMDFGKWMGSGVSYADSRRLEWLQKRLSDSVAVKNNIDDGKGMVLTRETDIQFATRNITGLESFIANAELKEYVFEDTNSYLRRYLYDTVERRFPHLTIKKNAEGKLCALKLDTAAADEHRADVEREAKEKYESEAGFRLVFDDLVAAKKPIIGHNLCFDLLFMLRWLDGPLPQTFSDLKDHLYAMFPTVYDTKYLAASGIMGPTFTSMATSLSDVFKRFVGDVSTTTDTAKSDSEDAVSAVPSVVVCPIVTAEGFPDFLNPLSEDAKQFHNAGYDAFCTGCVFARQASTLDSITPIAVPDVPDQSPHWRQNANNMLFMMRSLYHMTLTPGPVDGYMKVRGVVFNVSGFAKDTKTDDVMTVFTKAFVSSEVVASGGESGGIDIIWADNNSVFVAVSAAVAGQFCLERGHSTTDLDCEEMCSAMSASIAEHLIPIRDKEQAAALALAGVQEESEAQPPVEVAPWTVVHYATYLAEKEKHGGVSGEDSARKRGGEEGGETPKDSKRARVA